jgi:hypothetical protein
VRAFSDQLQLKQRGFDSQMNDLKTRIGELNREKAEISKKWADEQRRTKMDFARLEQENKELRAKLMRYNAEILGGSGNEKLVSGMMASMLSKKAAAGSKDEQVRMLALRVDALQLEKLNLENDVRILQRENADLREENRGLMKTLTEWKSAKALFDLKHPPSDEE